MKHVVECIGVTTGTAVKPVPVWYADEWDIPGLVGTVHLCNLPPPIHVPSALVMYLLLVSGASASSEPFSNDTSSIEGLRTRVNQPKIKYWKLHELCKNAIKNVHTIWACGQKFQISKYSAASEMHFKSIPMLGGANSTFVG